MLWNIWSDGTPLFEGGIIHRSSKLCCLLDCFLLAFLVVCCVMFVCFDVVLECCAVGCVLCGLLSLCG